MTKNSLFSLPITKKPERDWLRRRSLVVGGFPKEKAVEERKVLAKESAKGFVPRLSLSELLKQHVDPVAELAIGVPNVC